MNRDRTTIERFAKSVELMKKSIVYYIKQTQKLMKQVKNANGDNDKKALLDKITEARENAERYRLVLEDLACAFVRENTAASEKVWKRFKYKTAEGFLADRDAPDKPSLAQMIDIITNHVVDIATIYHFEYNEIGQRTVKRDLSLINADEFRMHFDTFKDQRDVRDAVSSGTRHK